MSPRNFTLRKSILVVVPLVVESERLNLSERRNKITRHKNTPMHRSIFHYTGSGSPGSADFFHTWSVPRRLLLIGEVGREDSLGGGPRVSSMMRL